MGASHHWIGSITATESRLNASTVIGVSIGYPKKWIHYYDYLIKKFLFYMRIDEKQNHNRPFLLHI